MKTEQYNNDQQCHYRPFCQICGTICNFFKVMYAKISTDGSVFLPLLFSIFVISCFLSIFSTSFLQAQENTHRIAGKVVKVIDGDSLKIETEEGLLEVRLYGVDAPEYDQWEAKNGKKWLKKYLSDSDVEIEKISIDRYNRQLAIVYKKNDDNAVNGAIVKAGYAWVYSRYCHKNICRSWKAGEKAARRAKLGVWRNKKPIPPWVWRHRKK